MIHRINTFMTVFFKPFQSEVSFVQRAICSKVNTMLNIFQGIINSNKVVFSLLKKIWSVIFHDLLNF